MTQLTGSTNRVAGPTFTEAMKLTGKPAPPPCSASSDAADSSSFSYAGRTNRPSRIAATSRSSADAGAAARRVGVVVHLLVEHLARCPVAPPRELEPLGADARA